MQDLKDRLEKLTAGAAECDMIDNLATDAAKCASFRRLAEQYRTMAEEMRTEIVIRGDGSTGALRA